jgi:ribonucleoside-diphosphate reductase alpha chain
VVERCAFPSEAIAAASRRTRKLGLGVMGLADLFLLRGLRYDAPAARRLTGELLGVIRRSAEHGSLALAEERGAFPAGADSGSARRNATLLAVAPTGTIRLLAGCNPDRPCPAGRADRDAGRAHALGGQWLRARLAGRTGARVLTR